MRQIKRIFVHCTAGSQRQTIDDLKAEFHRKGWSNPGYHYVIDTNGGVHQLLAIEHVSNGVQGYNSTAINVAYIGGIDADGKPMITAHQRKRRSCAPTPQAQTKVPNGSDHGPP